MPVQPSRVQTKLPGVGGGPADSGYNRPAGAALKASNSVPSLPSSPESRSSSSQPDGKVGGRNREVFSKTRMCKFYLRGQCKHGSDCGYAHDWSELRQAPDLRKTKMCQLYRKGQCPNGADCAYAHSRDELRATADVYKTSLCRFWMNGSCNAGSKCRHAHGAHELRTRVPTAAGTDAVLTASTTNRLAEVAAANEDPDLMATAASLVASQKASLGSTMAMNDYLEQANLLEQIAKTLEQINETTGSSGFTAGDEVTLRLRSYTGGRDVVAALLDDPPASAPSVTNTLPTVPVPSLDADAPVFVPRKSISSISNEQLQQLQSIIEEGSFNIPSAASTPLKGPATPEPSAASAAAADSRPRGLSGWKPYEPSNVNSRRLSQIATILEAKRRLSSFSLAPPGIMPGQNLPPMPSPNREVWGARKPPQRLYLCVATAVDSFRSIFASHSGASPVKSATRGDTSIPMLRRSNVLKGGPPGGSSCLTAGVALYVIRRGKRKEPALARIDELIVYPIKSAAGVQVDRSEVTWKGLKHDRSYCIVVPVEESQQGARGEYRVLTQRTAPQMSRLHPSLPNSGGISLTFANADDDLSYSIRVPLQREGERITVAVWGEEARGIDQGDAVAERLSRHLEVPGARLIKSVDKEEFLRCLPPKKGGREGDGIDFQDGFPLLLLSRASASQLISHVPIAVGRCMDYRRFRPNILLDGCPAYTEEKYSTAEFEREDLGFSLDLTRPCSRCTVPSVDPDTGIMDTTTKEPFPTLFNLRRGAVLYAIRASKKDKSVEAREPIVARIDQLIVYPIKSAAGVQVDHSEVTWKGLKHDRSYCIVVPVEESQQGARGEYRALSQAKTPRMSLIHPSLPSSEGITLSFMEDVEQPSTIHVPLLTDSRRITIVLWGNTAMGIDQGDAVAEWLSGHLGIPGTRFLKSVDDDELTRYLSAKARDRGHQDGHGLDFHYNFPLDVLSRASAAQLICRVPVNVGRTMDHRRFRSNILLDGCPPFAEERYSTIKFQDNPSLSIEFDRLCDRCSIPSVDPDTGVMDTKTKEPYPTLLKYRRGSLIKDSCHPRHRQFITKHNKSVFMAVHATPRFAEGASSCPVVVRVGDVVHFV
ncbi:hypothetical protein FOL46_009662 [Perkinsus olseni]|uniref:Uncharacterized protein n=1 Tax=Perkinsus olseni TaxID=32597 RepID=A0A7J6MKL2_PEROL|nr:hypothetical protein FOL46_009662 [Perkinsus olseni]